MACLWCASLDPSADESQLAVGQRLVAKGHYFPVVEMVAVEVLLVGRVDLLPQIALEEAGHALPEITNPHQPIGCGRRICRGGSHELFVGHVRGEYEARLTPKRGSSRVAANALAGENFRLDNVPSRICFVPDRLDRPRAVGTTADEN